VPSSINRSAPLHGTSALLQRLTLGSHFHIPITSVINDIRLDLHNGIALDLSSYATVRLKPCSRISPSFV
jgi:predicted nuclease with TOPRIM domain